MDRTSWIGLICCIVAFVGWFYYQGSQTPLPPVKPPIADKDGNPKKEDDGKTPKVTADPESKDPEKTTEPKSTEPNKKPEEIAKAEPIVLKNGEISEVKFSNIGGGIDSVTLLKHLKNDGDEDETIKDKPLEERERLVLNNYPVPVEDGSLFKVVPWRVPIGALSDKVGVVENRAYEMRKVADRAVVFEGQKGDLAVKKTFKLPDEKADPYTMTLELEFTNTGEEPIRNDDLFIYLGSAVPLDRDQFQDFEMLGYYAAKDDSFEKIKTSDFSDGWFSDAPEEVEEKVADLLWANVADQFYTTAIRSDKSYRGKIWAKSWKVDKVDQYKKAEPVSGIYGAMGLPEIQLGQGQTEKLTYHLYIGPKKYSRLSDLDDTIAKETGQDPRLKAMMNFGWPVFRHFSRLLIWSLNGIHDWFGNTSGSWGWAIIVLTIFIRIVIWPLHYKSTMTMKKMSKLAPKMTELKEKYKDNPQKMNQEMMLLYRTYGVNPMGGCLPMFAQIPIFFAFYTMLQSAVELRHQDWFWVADLSMPDTVFEVGGFPINLLPILMGITMVLQMKMTPQTGDPTQRRIFMLMPLVFLFFCYNFASALALYWTSQNIFSIGQTWFMQRKGEPELEKKELPKKDPRAQTAGNKGPKLSDRKATAPKKKRPTKKKKKGNRRK